MCQTCIGCGKCTGEVRQMLSAGICPRCKHENPPTASKCESCGSFLPMAPGAATVAQ